MLSPDVDSVSSVESVGNESLGVDLVQDPVSITLQRRGEDNQFELLTHVLDELLGIGSHIEGSFELIVDVVHQSFVQVQH